MCNEDVNESVYDLAETTTVFRCVLRSPPFAADGWRGRSLYTLLCSD